jgi:SOS-response transcriptional repressor LexA
MNDKTPQVYDFIRMHIERHGYAPTRHEIVVRCQIDAGMVVSYLSRLAVQGLIEYVPGKPRGIKLKQSPPDGEGQG